MATKNHNVPQEAEAAQPSLVENLALMEQQTSQLEAEASSLAGTREYPEWWHQEAISKQLITDQLKESGIDPSNISRYFQLYKRQQQLYTTITGFNDDNILGPFCYLLGFDVAARGFRSEQPDGLIHIATLEAFANATERSTSVATELKLLREVYEVEKVTDLFGISGDTYTDALRPFIRTGNIVKWMRFADEENGIGLGSEQMRTNTRKWMGRALSAAAGINENEADNYVFAASRRDDDRSIIDISDRFEHFGVDRLRAISDFTGIDAFEGYSVAQRERMENLLRNPQQAAELLSRRDVNVVMVNRVGDHNGVMHNAAADFEDDNERTLFFEINNLGDIYRHMLTLNNLGVRPSTLVLAAHSSPGQFTVPDIREPSLQHHSIATTAGRNLVKIVSERGDAEEGEAGYSMHGMKGMARLVEDYMQPSRAIDDVQEDAGRKKILFQACHAASETESKDMDNRGTKFTIGMDSIVGRLGNDLAANEIDSSVDIYGAPGGIQLHRSDRGVRYSGQPASFGEERQPLHAVRVRVEKGNVSTQSTDEVILRKAA